MALKGDGVDYGAQEIPPTLLGEGRQVSGRLSAVVGNGLFSLLGWHCRLPLDFGTLQLQRRAARLDEFELLAQLRRGDDFSSVRFQNPALFGLQSGELRLDVFGRFFSLPPFPSFGAVQLAKWLQDDLGLQDYVPDCFYNGIIENSLGNARHSLAARDAAVIEPTVTGIAAVPGTATATPHEALQQVGVLLVSRRERDVPIKLLLDPLPGVARDEVQGFRQSQGEPFALGTSADAALAALAVPRARCRVLRLAALEFVVMPDAGVDFAPQDSEDTGFAPFGRSLPGLYSEFVEAVQDTPGREPFLVHPLEHLSDSSGLGRGNFENSVCS